MKIKIAIWSMEKTYSVYADEQTNDFSIGMKRLEKGVDNFVKNAIEIVKDWPEEVYDDNMMDGISFQIAYEDESGCYVKIGRNKTPIGFNNLITLIRSHEPNNENFIFEEEQRSSMTKMSSEDLKELI